MESDGPIPGPNSMLSFGSAAFFEDGNMVDTFTANFLSLEGAKPDPSTAAWWASPERAHAWAEVNKDRQDPAVAMREYVSWLKHLPGKPVFVGYPAGYDFMFVYWYLVKFVGESPFSFSAIDVKTMAMTILRTNYRETSKRTMPKRWFPPNVKHTHVALDDAIEQGTTFCLMLKESRLKNGT